MCMHHQANKPHVTYQKLERLPFVSYAGLGNEENFTACRMYRRLFRSNAWLLYVI